MKKLYILAPNDRFNYGDLLFSHILRFYFEKYVDQCVFVSTTKSDLSKFGGLPTKAFDELYNVSADDENILIVAGGECLLAQWHQILVYVDDFSEKIFVFFVKKLKLKKLAQLLLDKILRRKWKYKTQYPFSIGKNELPLFSRIFYNSLGGTSLYKDCSRMKKAKTKNILGSVDYLAVRDCLTYKALMRENIRCKLVPDSAILMSEVFSENFLVDSLSISPNTVAEKEYVFFQTSPLGEEREKEAAEFLSEACTLYGKKVVLCPIGTARLHSDQIALRNIFKRLPKEMAFIVENPNVWDIMWLIKHACLYVGTSLHGTISAMSFGVPFAVHGQPKVRAYIETWAPQFTSFYSSFSGLRDNVLVQLRSPSVCEVSQQKELMLMSIENMRKMI